MGSVLVFKQSLWIVLMHNVYAFCVNTFVHNILREDFTLKTVCTAVLNFKRLCQKFILFSFCLYYLYYDVFQVYEFLCQLDCFCEEQGFSNTIKGWGISPSWRGMGNFAGGNFLIGWWKSEEECFWPFEPFSKLKTTFGKY